LNQILPAPTYLDLRTELHQMVIADLLGPAGGPIEGVEVELR
jgi:hypothetical protein